MGRVVEILVGVNALCGIVVFLTVRRVGRKAKTKVEETLGIRHKEGEGNA